MIVRPPMLRPKWSVLLIASAALLTLGGCVNFAGIKSDRHIDAPSKYEANGSLPAEGGKWPSLDWSEQFGDPQLPRLIDEALKDNPDIDEARARLNKAASYVGNANSKLYPNVNASYSWTRELNTENTVYPPAIGGVWNSENTVMEGASWDLDLWGKNHERLRQATSGEKVAQAEMEEVRITLSASVASTYNELARLYRLRDIAVQELKNREEIGRITNGRVVAGLDTNVEKQTAMGDIATTRSTVSNLDGRITVVRYQIGALLGAGPDRGVAIAVPALGSGAPVVLPDSIPADLVSRRPDVVAAFWQVNAATHGIKEAKAEFYPDVNLSAAVGLDAFGWGRFLTASSRQISAGPAIHLPIFDAGALRAQLKGRYADFDFDVANYNKTLINALSDVASQVALIRSTDKQLVEARQAFDAQSKAYRLAVVRYGSGLTQQLTVLNADNNRLAAEVAVANLTMDRRNSQVALIKALGGGFDSANTDLSMSASAPAASPAADKAPQ